MPLLEKVSVLAASIEATPGTAETLDASDGAMNVSNKRINDTTEYVPLMGQGSLSNIRGSHGPRLATATFDVELQPGSGSLPPWASVLLPACGYVVSTSTYTPRSEVPGSNVKTATIGLWTNGIRELMYGASGNAVFNFSAGRPVSVSFSFTGSYTKTVDEAIIAPNYPLEVQPLRAVSSSLVIGSDSPQVESWTLDLGNNLYPIPDGNSASGIAYTVITNRTPTISMTPNTELVATFDPWADFEDHTLKQISWSLARGGVGVTFTAPKCELSGPPQGGERGGLRTDQLTYLLVRNADGGDDELSIAFDITP